MDMNSCLSTITSLLSSSKRLQPFTKQLHLEVSSYDVSSTLPSPSSSVSDSALNFTKSTSSSSKMVDDSKLAHRLSDPLPIVFVTCRHSSNAGIPVDNLGGGKKEDDHQHHHHHHQDTSVQDGVSGIGFFNLDGITILHDRVSSRADIEQLLVHELVHAVDYHVSKLDLSSCGGLACSEVRAAKFAECHASWELGGVKKRCASNFAKISTRMVFGPTDGPHCVDYVLNECYDKRIDAKN